MRGRYFFGVIVFSRMMDSNNLTQSASQRALERIHGYQQVAVNDGKIYF
jgi:hypothetical protein